MKMNKKALALLVCVTLLLTITVSGTVAYLVDNDGPVTNTFTPTEVDTTITDTVTTGAKSEIIINNPSGDKKIPVYVRVAIVGNWVVKDATTNTEQIVRPATKEELAFTLGDKWVQHTDGYYYYTEKVAVGGYTSDLLGSDITAKVNAEDGSYLVVTVIHQSIQAEPTAAVLEAWKVDPTTLPTN